MADTRTFEAYFAGRTALVGQQSPSGDEYLALRGGTVFRATQVYIKGFAYDAENLTPTPTSVVNTWTPLANTLVQGVTTPTLTFSANQFTYIGPNQIVQSSLKAAISAYVATGTNLAYEVGVFVNDLLIGVPMQVAVSDTGMAYVAADVQRILVTGDVIDMRVRNVTDGTSLIVANAQLVIG